MLSAVRLFGGHALVIGMLAELGCAGRATNTAGERSSDDAIAVELEAMTGSIIAEHTGTFRGILEDALAKDAYVCRPTPRQVFFGEAPAGVRTIRGSMPHYGLFFGPMHYRIRHGGPDDGVPWSVTVSFALDAPAVARIELPDCRLAKRLEGDVRCQGLAYSRSGSTEACPRSGSFDAPATRENLRALLDLWSSEAERYYNRDAADFGLPVRYDFEFVLADERAAPEPPDMKMPISPTCGRTPYFAALRTGWSLPILAHEVGHVMGLLDEYETFSGIVSAYPKTPFPGAQVSRMGLSMREGTRVLPLHHYLVLRRYFCPEPSSRNPYGHAL